MSQRRKQAEDIWSKKPKQMEFPPLPNPRMCKRAQEFSDWVEEMLEGLRGERSIRKVNECKIFLLDNFTRVWNHAPKKHRILGESSRAHHCIFRVFRDADAEIRRWESALQPPSFERIIEKKVPQKPVSPFGGLLVGGLEPDPRFDEISGT